VYVKIILILGNVASAYTENDSVQKESSNSLKISRAESEMFNDESDQYKDKRGILYFLNFVLV